MQVKMSIETNIKDDGKFDDVDDEVILFKPGEGTKVENETVHLKTAIGSGRMERPSSSEGRMEMVNHSPRPQATSPTFDLFGGNTSNNNSLFSNFPTVGVQSPFAPLANPSTNTMFGNTNFSTSSHQNTSYAPYPQQTSPKSPSGMEFPYGPTPMSSVWGQTSAEPPGLNAHSFFTSAQLNNTRSDITERSFQSGQYATTNNQGNVNGPQQTSGQSYVNGPLAWLPQNEQQTQSGQFQYQQFNPAPLPFPFPGGTTQQQRYKTKNPFIS